MNGTLPATAAGQYLPGSSLLHRLDPRLKLGFSLVVVVSLFLVSGWAGLGVLAAGLATALALSRAPLPYLLRGLLPLLILLLVTFLVQAFALPGTVIWQAGPFELTLEGISRGGFLCVRLALLFVSGALVVMTTPPVGLTDALAWYMAPLGRLGFPSWDVAMMMSIALRFIPTLMREFGDLVKAQRARGIDVSLRSVRGLTSGLLPLIVPLFVLSFRQADVLATAMVSRCYQGGGGRTHFRHMQFGRADTLVAVLAAMWVVLALGMGRSWWKA